MLTYQYSIDDIEIGSYVSFGGFGIYKVKSKDKATDSLILEDLIAGGEFLCNSYWVSTYLEIMKIS